MRHLSKMNQPSASVVQLLALVAAFLCIASAQDAHATSSSTGEEIPSIMAPAVGALQAPGRSLLRNPPTYVAGTPFNVVATGKSAGYSPERYGLNLGHAGIGSNWLQFMDRMGMNYARIFLSNINGNLRTVRGSTFGRALDGSNVGSVGAYKKAVAQMRSPAGRDLNRKWAVPLLYKAYDFELSTVLQGRWGSYAWKGTAADTIKRLRARGVDILAVLTLECSHLELKSTSTASAAYWQERWELYNYVYQFGRWTESHGVANIELYNEPDRHTGKCLNNQYMLDQIRIRSQALRDSYADGGGKVTIIGLAFGSVTYKGSYFELAVKNNRLTFPGNTKPASYKNMDRFSYHVYGGSGYYYGVSRDASNMPLDMTEYGNSLSSVAGYKTGDINDQGPLASRLASLSAYLLRANVPRMCIFKASQNPKTNNPATSYVSYFGIHWAESVVAPYDFGDSNLSGEVAGLIMRKTAGRKPMLEVTTTYQRRAGTTAFAVTDALSIYLYVVNDDSSSKPLVLNLTKWSAAVGGAVLVNQVSADILSAVVAKLTLPTSKKFKFKQPRFSVLQFVIPRGRKPVAKVLAPTAIGGVAGGTRQASKFVGAPSFNVVLSTSKAHEKTSVGFMKFDIRGIKAGKVQAATLAVRVLSSASAASPLMVLAVGSSWTQAALSWNTAPSLKNLPNGRVINRIGYNFIDWTTTPAPIIAGHIVVPGKTKARTFTIDVTDSVNAALSGKTGSKTRVTFMIARIFRRNRSGSGATLITADPVGSNSVSFSALGAAGPRLTVYQSP